MTLRDELMAAAAPPHEDITVAGVPIRMVGLGVLDQLELSDMGGVDATFWLIERMARDEHGQRVFEDNDPQLRGMRLDVVNDLAEVARKLLQMETQVKN